jgi:ribose transport system permease protein
MKKFLSFASTHIWIWSLVLTVILLSILSFISEEGFSMQSLLLNLTIMSFIVILGMGQMIVITSGNGAIDLSIPNNLGLASYICCALTFSENGIVLPLWLAILITLTILCLIGLLSGLITVYLRIPAIVTTLAVSYMVYTALLILMPRVIGTPDATLTTFTRLRFAGISVLTIFAFVVAAVFAFLIYKTRYGVNLRAMGQGHQIARMAGININRTLIITFIISALCSAVGGILIGAYNGGAYVQMGDYYHLPTIASVVLGGTLISGGRCSVAGVIFGAVMLTILGSLMTVSGLSYGTQQLIQGMVLVGMLIFSISGKKV